VLVNDAQVDLQGHITQVPSSFKLDTSTSTLTVTGSRAGCSLPAALPSLGSPIREAPDQAVGDERLKMMLGFSALSERSFASTTLEAQNPSGLMVLS
jgi:hypothetical protein